MSSLLRAERGRAPGRGGEAMQIVFLISDGRFDQDGRERIRAALRSAAEAGQLFVLLIVDGEGKPAAAGSGSSGASAAASSSAASSSILDTKLVSFVKGKVSMVPYMEGYPFGFYLIMRRVASMPETLADALRQWFEMIRRDT
jgi:midasin